MFQKIKQRSISTIILIIYSYLCYLMIKICMLYFPWQDHTNFLALKQDFVHHQPWRFAFQIHVIASSFALIAGLTQFFKTFRTTKWKPFHRYSGYFYIIIVLIFALPSGFILAIYALGGLSTQISFILLSILWGLSTFLGLYYALKQQWFKHRDWMIRSFALTLSALSLRSWKLLLYELSPYWEWLTPIHIYQLQSWLGWTINLLLAELIILKLYQKNKL